MTETVLPRRRRMRHALALPNLLTYGRLVAVPVVALLLQWPEVHWMRWAALGVYTVACVTDFFDGYLARIWKQQSPLGQMLDPIADKLLVATTLLAVAANQTLVGWTIWAAIITVQMFALGFFIAGPAGEVVLPGTVIIGGVLLWIAAILTLYTAADYLIAGWPHFGDEDET